MMQPVLVDSYFESEGGPGVLGEFGEVEVEQVGPLNAGGQMVQSFVLHQLHQGVGLQVMYQFYYLLQPLHHSHPVTYFIHTLFIFTLSTGLQFTQLFFIQFTHFIIILLIIIFSIMHLFLWVFFNILFSFLLLIFNNQFIIVKEVIFLYFIIIIFIKIFILNTYRTIYINITIIILY